MISIIVAVANNGVIGNEGTIPWRIPEDLKRFKQITVGDVGGSTNAVIMGRKTFESIGKALPNRHNIVVSRQLSTEVGAHVLSLPHSKEHYKDVCVVGSLGEALLKTAVSDIFVIGGASLYQQALSIADRLYITKVLDNYKGDTYFPYFNLDDWKLISMEHFDGNPSYEFCVYDRKK
jgi:dihydrofolate reductase